MRVNVSPKRIFLTALCLCGVMVGFVRAAPGIATSAQSITLTPSHVEVTIAPGSTASDVFRVMNEGDTDYSVSMYAKPYRVQGEAYDPQFTPLPGTTDASAWVSIAGPTTQTLAAHQALDVAYTISAPRNTAPGGYYAVLFTETSTSTASGGIVTHDRVGDVLYITVAGPVQTGGAVREVSVPYITMASDVSLGVLVSNTGGVHFSTDASFVARNLFGKVVFQSTSRHHVLPQTVRRITATWKTPMFGLYRIERSATVAGRTQHIADHWVVVLRPWMIVLLCGILVLCIADMVIRRKRSRPKI